MNITMADDFQSGSFWIAIASIIAAIIAGLTAHCFKMKCSNVSLCGMKFIRDIELENKSYDLELQQQLGPSSLSSTSSSISRRNTSIV